MNSLVSRTKGITGFTEFPKYKSFNTLLFTAGYRDFIPRNMGTKVEDCKFETLSQVLKDSQSWMSRHEDKRITNLQTVEYMLPKDLFGREYLLIHLDML